MRILTFHILIRLTVLVVAVAGCDIGSLAGSFVPVAPVPTIPPATLTAAQNWPIVFSDDFSSNANSWNLSKTQPETNGSGTFRERIGDGALQVESQATENVSKQFWPTMDDVGDLYLTADAQRLSGESTAGYGVIYHWTDQLPSAYLLGNFYLFEIRDDQQFGVFLFQGDWIDLIKLTRTNAIQPGAVNHLAVLVQGAHQSFFVNQQLVGSIDDARVPSGKAGVAIDMNAGTATLSFSHFQVRAPK